MKNDPTTVLNLIAQTIYDKKGINTLALDIRSVSTITDFAVIAEGNVDKHVIAIAKAVLEALEGIGEKPLHVEGLTSGDWVVLDFLDFMVHIFMPGLRDKYQLEQLWKEGKILDLNIVVSNEASDSYARTRRK
jgi:ribosome-associated protein